MPTRVVTINVLWLFLTVSPAGLQCVIVIFLIKLTYFSKSKSFLASCVSTYDFSTLYTTLRHNLIKEKLTE